MSNESKDLLCRVNDLTGFSSWLAIQDLDNNLTPFAKYDAIKKATDNNIYVTVQLL